MTDQLPLAGPPRMRGPVFVDGWVDSRGAQRESEKPV